jgi:hypothetical protein
MSNDQGRLGKTRPQSPAAPKAIYRRNLPGFNQAAYGSCILPEERGVGGWLREDASGKADPLPTPSVSGSQLRLAKSGGERLGGLSRLPKHY